MTYRRIASLILALTLVVNISAAVFAPAPVQAAPIKSTVAKFGGCFAAGVLTDAAKNLIDKGIKSAIDNVKNLAEGPLKSFLGGFLSVFGGSIPTSDSGAAQAAQDNFAAITNAQTRNAILTRCAALAIMTTMTNNILTVARTSGRDGGPTFVTNWTNFQTNAQYRGENIARAELSTAKLCPYLSDDVKKSFGVDPKVQTPIKGQNLRSDSLQPFSLQTNCTLPVGFTPTKYQQDFAGQGGWDTFVRLLQPQNNAYGLQMITQDEIEKQRVLAVSTDVAQVTANNGFVGVSGNGKADSCQIMGPGNQCLTFKNIKTSGNIISQNIGATIGAQFAWLTSAQGLNTIISDATEVMLNRLLDFSNPDEGNYHAANDTGSAYNVAPTAPTAQPFCTSTGASEQAFMLPLLNGGTAPQDVANQTNAQFSLTTGNQAVYYPDSNTVGVPEFYMSGPTPDRPVSPTTGALWDVTVRCVPQSTGGAGGAGAGGSSDTNNLP